MSKDQLLGVLLMAASIIVAIIYIYALLSPAYTMLVLQLTAGAIVLAVLFIIGWIGYTLATTPPPPPIEELEKELEEEAKTGGGGKG